MFKLYSRKFNQIRTWNRLGVILAPILVVMSNVSTLASVNIPGANVLVDNIPTNKQSQLWRINLSGSYSRSLYLDPVSNLSNASGNLTFGFIYLGFKSTNLMLSSAVTQDLERMSYDQSMVNIRFNTKKPFIITEDSNYLMGISAGLPVGQFVQNSSLLGTLTLHNVIFFTNTAPWDFIFNYNLTRFFFEYETSKNGMINNQWANRASVSISYTFSDKWIFTGNFGYRNRVSFQNEWRENIFHSQDMTYLITKQSSISLGHSWGDTLMSLFKSNGQDLEFNLIDDRNSLVYLTYGITI